MLLVLGFAREGGPTRSTLPGFPAIRGLVGVGDEQGRSELWSVIAGEARSKESLSLAMRHGTVCRSSDGLGEDVEGMECTCGSPLRMPPHTPSALPLRAVTDRFEASTPSEPMHGVDPETIESYFQAFGPPARTSVRP